MRPLLVALLCLCLPLRALAYAPNPLDAPLDAIELEAIVAEADERYRKWGDNSSDPKGPPWRTLTRAKLAQLQRSSQLARVGWFARSELLDQAFAWDLVHFRNAGDIKRFFVSVRGADQFEPPAPNAGLLTQRVAFHSDATASADGGAVSALFNCLPWATWVVEADDPLLWSMQRGEAVDVPNTHDFGQCVRRQRDLTGTPSSFDPVSPRGTQSAAIIEKRLSRQLLAQGCDGTGPDACLVNLRALMSLSPQHPDLVAIVRKLHAQVEATRPVAIPDALKALAAAPDPALQPLLQQTRNALWRRGIVLSAELDLMQARPEEWEPEEIDAAVDAAIAQMLAWRRLDWSINSLGMHDAREYGFEMPWTHLDVDGRLPVAIEARVRRLGEQEAVASGCDAARLAREGQPAEFWYAFGSAKLRRENQDCRALPLAWIAARYLQASREGRAPALAEIEPWVHDAAQEIHDRVDLVIGNHCPASDWGSDPWGICARRAAFVAAERDRERARNDAERAQAQAMAADPCREELLAWLQQRFGYLDAEGNETRAMQAACKRLPDAPATAAVAIFHLAHPFDDTPGRDGDYDLHLLVIDKDGKVLAQAREAKAATSDAVSLDVVAIDTGRFHLAPGVRAFGVSTTNAAHCYQCAWSETKLSLFVREGKRLRKVLDGLLQGERVGEDDTDGGCMGATAETVRTIALASTRHAGFADLEVTATTRHEPGFDAELEECAAVAPGESVRETWVYDGKRYRAQ